MKRTRSIGASRRPAPMIALAIGLASSAGCAIDEGTALADAFVEDWAGVSDVAEVDTTEWNAFPFVGEASGTLILEDGTSTDRVVELAGELREYVADHDGLTGRIAVDDFTFAVVASEDRAEDVLGLWRSPAADDRLVTGRVDQAVSGNDHAWKVLVSAPGGADALAMFEDLVGDGGPYYRMFPWVEESSLLVDVGGSFSVATDGHGAVPSEAIAAYEAVASRYSVVGASLSTDHAGIHVEEGTDAAEAESLARNAAPRLGDAVVVVVGGV